MPRLMIVPHVVLAAALATVATAAQAHPGEPLAPHDLPWAWSLEPWVVAALLISASLYGRGLRRWRRRQPHAPAGIAQWAFASGWAAVVLALVSPLDALGGVLFSAHMAQHEVLMLIAAPLLVAARPFPLMALGLPRRWMTTARPLLLSVPVRTAWRWLTAPWTAWALHGAVIWVWHAPALFEATLTSELAHTLQHGSFFVSALLFWWATLHRADAERHYGMAFLYVFTTAVHTTVLGAFLVLSQRAWYPAYAATTSRWGLTLLEDQQLGGLIMWVPAGIAYGATAMILFARWMHVGSRSRTAATTAVVVLSLTMA